jgi:hypothetical protein
MRLLRLLVPKSPALGELSLSVTDAEVPSGRRNAMTRTPQEVFAHHGQADASVGAR